MTNLTSNLRSSFLALVLLLTFIHRIQAVNTASLPQNDLSVIDAYQGKELSLKERIALKLFKKRIERAMKKAQTKDCAKMVTIYGKVLEIEDVNIYDEIIEYRRCRKNDDFISEMNLSEVSRVIDAHGKTLYDSLDRVGENFSESEIETTYTSPKRNTLNFVLFVLGIIGMAILTLFGIALLIIQI